MGLWIFPWNNRSSSNYSWWEEKVSCVLTNPRGLRGWEWRLQRPGEKSVLSSLSIPANQTSKHQTTPCKSADTCQERARPGEAAEQRPWPEPGGSEAKLRRQAGGTSPTSRRVWAGVGNGPRNGGLFITQGARHTRPRQGWGGKVYRQNHTVLSILLFLKHRLCLPWGKLE